MSKFRVFIQPFLEDGEYSGEYIDITEDVIDMGAINKSLDNTEYDIGVFRNDNITLKLRNSSGRFSDVSNPESIFAYRRSNSLVKVTWDQRNEPLICGFFTPETAGVVGGQYEVFKGVLNDIPSRSNVNRQEITFQVLGLESILDEVEVPFADISIGDTIEEVIYAMLNQPAITNLLTVSPANISVDENQALDVVADFENKTVLKALTDEKLLLAGNAVLYVRNDTIYVQPRTATSAVMFNFFGQAAFTNIENIIDIENFGLGKNRVFNNVTWQDTDLTAQDTSSIELNGVQTKDLDINSFTNTTKRQNILNAIRDEFGDEKKEFDLTAPVTYDILALFLLDRVTVDYPPVVVPAEGTELPIYGVTEYGFLFPNEDNTFVIEDDERFKIMSLQIDPKTDTISFHLREI